MPSFDAYRWWGGWGVDGVLDSASPGSVLPECVDDAPPLPACPLSPPPPKGQNVKLS